MQVSICITLNQHLNPNPINQFKIQTMKVIKLYSPGVLGSSGHLPASTKNEEKSPYLKSVLSANIGRTGRVIQMAISDHLAAIKYIKESQWRSNFFRG